MNRAIFDYGTDENILWIEDLDQGKSVTNDIEYVLQDIQDSGIDIYNYRIMYKDSTGIWDGISISKESNPSFFAIQEKEYEKAKEKLLNRK
jgi:hypothetical protein